MSANAGVSSGLYGLNRAESRSSGWRTFWAILLIGAGLMSLFFPLASALAAQIWLGWLFIVGGFVTLVQAFRWHSRGHFWLSLLSGIFSLAAGILMLAYPLAAVMSLTYLLGVLFLVEGIYRFILAFRWRPLVGWGWILFGGAADALLGMLVLAQWPTSALWTIGLLLGVHFIHSGIYALTFGSRAEEAFLG